MHNNKKINNLHFLLNYKRSYRKMLLQEKILQKIKVKTDRIALKEIYQLNS